MMADETIAGPQSEDAGNVLRSLAVFLAVTWFFLSMYRVTISVALPDVVDVTSVTYAEASLLFGALFVGYAVSQFPAGSLADSRRSRTILLGGGLTACIALASLAVAASYVHVFVALFVVGLGLGTFRAVSQVAISASVSADAEGKALGFLTAAEPFSYVVGPATVAFLIETGGLFTMPLVLSLAPIPFLAVVCTSLQTRHRSTEPGVKTPSLRSGVAALTSHLLERPTLLVIGFGTAFSVTTNALIAILPWYIVDTTGLSMTVGSLYAGVVFGLGAVAAVSAGILRDRIGSIPIVVAGFGATALSIALLELTSTFFTTLLTLGAFSVALNSILPARDQLINTHARTCSQSDTGAVIGGLRSLCYLGGGIGAVVVGLTFARFGRETGFGLLTIVLLFGSLCAAVLWSETGDRY